MKRTNTWSELGRNRNSSQTPQVSSLPRPARKFLLAGTALMTGVFSGALGASDSALAACTLSSTNTLNCSDTFTVDAGGEIFSPDDSWQLNILGLGQAAPGEEAHISSQDEVLLDDDWDNPVITINADGKDGVVQMGEETSVTGSSGKGDDRDGIVINDPAVLDLYINGVITTTDDDGERTLHIKNGDGDTQITLNIGATGQLGAESDDRMLDVDGDVLPTVINNYGTMNGRMTFDDGAGAVTVNNYSVNTWNTAGVNQFTNSDDEINNNGGSLNTDGPFSIFYLKEGSDTLLNTDGGSITTSSEGLGTSFYFDNPTFCDDVPCEIVSGAIDLFSGTPIGALPVAFTEDGDQFNDTLENTNGATFTTNDATFFFFGGGNDELLNSYSADFTTNDDTLFAFGTGGDLLQNTEDAIFNANDTTTFFFDNPDSTVSFNATSPFFSIAGIPFTENTSEGAQGEDVFVNSEGATFNAGISGGDLDVTSFFFGGGNDQFRNEEGGTFNANDLTIISMGSGNDEFWNQKGGTFNTSGGTSLEPTLISFDTPDLAQGDDQFWNRWGGTFNANNFVAMQFGGGSDEFYNVEGGTINVDGVTEVFFGEGTDTAWNYSEINVSGWLNFWDLEDFYNSGGGSGGILDMRDGDIDDLTSITGKSAIDLLGGLDEFFGAGNFHGGYDSGLGVDVFLGPDGGPDTGSDLLALGGNIYGMTEIAVEKLNPDFGGFNEEGIPVVLYGDLPFIEYECDGPCAYGDAFAISPDSPDYIEIGAAGAIEDGLFAWFLFQDDEATPDNGAFELRGLAGPGAINAAGIATGAQTFFWETGSVVADHIYGGQFIGTGGAGADLATTDYVAPDYAAPASPVGTQTGLWVKATGSWVDRDTSVTENMVTYDTGLSQDIYSILGGADMKPGGPDSAVRVGLFGGYGASNLDFDLGSTSVEYEGGIVGAYAAYNNGAFYIDATVKGDILDTTYKFAGTSVDADVYNVGVLANTGYRMNVGGAFIEPTASLGYVYTNVDDFTAGGGTVSFSENDSLRAGAGARVGTAFALGGGKAELSVLGKVWNEFMDANSVTVTDMALNSTTYSDDINGVFGEASTTLAMTNAAGTLSGFLTGGGKFGEEFTSWNAQVGVRKGF